MKNTLKNPTRSHEGAKGLAHGHPEKTNRQPLKLQVSHLYRNRNGVEVMIVKFHDQWRGRLKYEGKISVFGDISAYYAENGSRFPNSESSMDIVEEVAC